VGARLNPPRYPPPPAREVRVPGVRATLVVHEHKRPGRDIDLATPRRSGMKGL
jgi:hypothetical protein